ICGNGLNGTVAAGQTVTFQGNGPCGSSTTTLGTITNNGTMVMDSTNAQGYSLLQGGALTNNGAFTTVKGAGGTRYIRVPFTNTKKGKVTIGSATTLIDSSTATANAGSWTVNAGAALSV